MTRQSERETVLACLGAARDLLSQPYAWTRGQFVMARRRAPGGRAFCAVGAIVETAPTPKVCRMAEQALQDVVGPHVVAWNDRASRKREILRAFSDAIELVHARREKGTQ